MMRALALAVLLTGCAGAPPCPPLPTMAAHQTLQEYTLHVVQLYHQCRGD